MTEAIAHSLVPVAIGAVAMVLVFGLVNLMRGGSASRSQSLMRWRIGLQFFAIIAVMLTIYAGGR